MTLYCTRTSTPYTFQSYSVDQSELVVEPYRKVEEMDEEDLAKAKERMDEVRGAAEVVVQVDCVCV